MLVNFTFKNHQKSGHPEEIAVALRYKKFLQADKLAKFK